MINKTIVFFVDNYSISFVKTEINFLAQKFNKVLVVCEQNYGDLSIPNVDLIIIDYKDYNGRKIVINNLFFFLNIFFTELIFFPKYIFYPKKITSIASNLLRSIYISKQIQQTILSQYLDCIFYTFWFNNWATALSMLVKKNKIAQYFSRVHGTDLYEERVAVFGKIPFRKFQLNNVAKIFSVSNKGEVYLKNKYPQFAKKVFTSYLGTNYGGVNPFNKGNIFTIVSCARVRNIKRIHLIYEILSHIDFPIKWIHIGNEVFDAADPTIEIYTKNKKNVQNKSNVEIVFLGNLNSEEVFNVYKSNPINLFISVSETEGLPVSMMEAISFGIPILSTDVGGCNEIVTSEIGILIPTDFNCVEVAEIISKFKDSDKNTEEFRNGAHKFWEQYFDNNKNGAKFIESIL